MRVGPWRCQRRLEASRVEDEPPAPSHGVRQRECDVLLHLHGTAREEERRQRRHGAGELHRTRRRLLLRRQRAERVDGLQLHSRMRRVEEVREQRHLRGQSLATHPRELPFGGCKRACESDGTVSACRSACTAGRCRHMWPMDIAAWLCASGDGEESWVSSATCPPT